MLLPTMSSRSHWFINCQLGRVPSRPMAPVTHGSRWSTAVNPSSAVATPAPSRWAISRTSFSAPSAPWPTSMATRSPLPSTCAACRMSASGGVVGPLLGTLLVW